MSDLLVRRSALLLGFAFLAIAESIYFGREVAASLQHLSGQRAFFVGDYVGAWRRYAAAVRWGGDPIEARTDQIELLMAGLEQREVGIRWNLPLQPDRALQTAEGLVAELIRRAPQRAYSWSLASDLHFLKARQARRARPIDLGALSENPTENLLPEDWLGLASLQGARELDAAGYTYADLLAEAYLGYGIVDRAARACRAAVAAFPVLSAHPYLSREGVPDEVVQAAAAGFEDALASPTVVSYASIESDLGRLLSEHGQDDRALPHLRRAVRLAPDQYDAHFHLGLIAYRARDFPTAEAEFRRTAALIPDSAWPHYYLGLCHAASGDPERAIAEFREAKRRQPLIAFFHALGGAFEGIGQIEEAERQYAAAANLNPDETSAWGALLAFFVRQKNWKGVAETCARLAEMGRAELFRDECPSPAPHTP
jgi:tetratricopeptide (TPR) repeat protein